MTKTSATDYYQILGVDRKASVDEIKKAYRRQAVKNHPDQGGDEAQFKRINEAYEVLSNPDKRQRYDQFGQAGLGAEPGPGGGFQNAQGFDFNFSGGDFDFGDIFSSLFGSRGGPGRRSQGLDAETEIEISFREAVFGVEKQISVNLPDVCDGCRGSRSQKPDGVKTCAGCQGRGQLQRQFQSPLGVVSQMVSCSDCQGQGQVISKPCPGCLGSGLVNKDKRIKIAIPAGVGDGTTIRAANQGPKNRQGRSGDLYLLLRVSPDKQFTREGNLILSQATIDLVQAALGAQIEVETVDGPVKIKVPAGTQSGTDFKIAGHGVPNLNRRGRGDHIVSLKVVTPTRLSQAQKQLLEQFKKVS